MPNPIPLLILLLLVLAPSCKRQPSDKQDMLAVATVNGEVLSRADFEQELQRELPPTEGGATPQQTEPVQRALLEAWIDRALLLQAARALNIAVTPEEVDRRVLRISADYPAEGFNEALAQGNLSMADLRQKTAAMLTIEKLFQGHVYSRVAVTEEELRQYFAEHQAEFQEPEQVRAAQIVVEGMDDAKKIQAQLKSGKKFADLARRYSLSPDAKLGGDLGYFPRGVMPPQFDEVAFRLGSNQISDVVATEYGYHLFKVLDKRPARKRELAEVRREVEDRLLKQKRTAAQADYLKQLREKAEIKINDRLVSTLWARPEKEGGK